MKTHSKEKKQEVVNKDRLTLPITNLFDEKEDAEKMTEQMSSLVYEPNEDIVEAHKEIFGPQNYCWRGSGERYWVWELGGCRVYVANGYGVAFEVEPEMEKEEALQHFEKYLDHWKE